MKSWSAIFALTLAGQTSRKRGAAGRAPFSLHSVAVCRCVCCRFIRR